MDVSFENWLRLVPAILYWTATGALVLHLFARPRDARATLLWLACLIFVPFIGPLFYILFGINTTTFKSWRKQASDEAFASFRPLTVKTATPSVFLSVDGRHGDFTREVDALTPDFPFRPGNEIRIFDAEAALDEMISAIGRAQHHIHLFSYIIGNDQVGRRVLNACAERARAGVQVRILYDAFGCAGASLHGLFLGYRKVPNLSIHDFSQSNIFKRKFQLHLRNHRKLLVIDGTQAFTGGVNFHSVYLPPPIGIGTTDLHFEIRGPIVRDLQYTFLRDWYYMTVASAESLLTSTFFPPLPTVGTATMRLLNSGPTPGEEAHALGMFFSAVAAAKTQVLAITPYFVPPSSLRLALRAAAARGVDVKILVPACNNHSIIRLASGARYRELLLGGVRIFERRAPFMHAKAMLIDDRIALIGSANLDPRSLFLNYETNLIIEDTAFGDALKQTLLAEIANADEIFYDRWRRRPFTRRLAENVANLFSPIS